MREMSQRSELSRPVTTESAGAEVRVGRPHARVRPVTRRAARAAVVGFTALAGFQAALAAGAPLGAAAWGGAHAELPPAQRAGSGIAVGVYLAAIVVVRRCAAGRAERRYRWGVWMLVAVLTAAAILNAVSPSAWEKAVLAPVAVVLAGLCSIVVSTSSGKPQPGRCEESR
jgi:hypothetical protein